MQIQLTLPALERLIGGDTEIEVALRRQVCEEFAKKHLKTIINDAAFKAISATWHAEINAAVAETMTSLRDARQEKLDSDGAGREAVRWSWNLRGAIDKAAGDAAAAAVDQAIKDRTANIAGLVRVAVNGAVDREVDAKLAMRVKDRTSAIGKLIEEEVEARIQERLKAAATIKG